MTATCQSEYNGDGRKHDHGGGGSIEGPASVVILVGFLIRDVGRSDLEDHGGECESEELVGEVGGVGGVIYVRARGEGGLGSARAGRWNEPMVGSRSCLSWGYSGLGP